MTVPGCRVAAAIAILLFSLPSGAADLVDVRWLQPGSPQQASPEASKALPEQPYDRAHLMPLHTISVLTWVCNDAGLRQAADLSDKAACYAAVMPAIEGCIATFQTKAPTVGNRAVNGRLKILDFRQQLRGCMVEALAQKQLSEGKVLSLSPAPSTDPLALALGGVQP